VGAFTGWGFGRCCGLCECGRCCGFGVRRSEFSQLVVFISSANLLNLQY